MRPLHVVDGAPGFEHGAGMRQRSKQGLVEQLVAQATDEGFGEGILHRLARRGVVPIDLVVVDPPQNGVRGELSAIVADDSFRLAALVERPIDLANYPQARDRRVGDERQAFARAIVDNNQDAHAAAVDKLISDKVERSALVRSLWHQHRRSCAQHPFAVATAADNEVLLAIEPEQAACGSR